MSSLIKAGHDNSDFIFFHARLLKYDNNMQSKIAIVHDSLTAFGGAERVLLALIDIFPNADIYTSLATQSLKSRIMNNSRGIFFSSSLSRWPFILTHSSFFKPYFYHYYWESIDLNQYDLIISSSHSFCANWASHKNKHISYIHTPPRFLYGQFNEMRWIKFPVIRNLLSPYWALLRNKDKNKINNIDVLVANSKNIRNRIKKNYNKNSIVIYPPVFSEQQIKPKFKKGAKYYLFFSRLVRQKGIELVIKTFNDNKKPLLVVGTGLEQMKWKKMANKNIRFLGFVGDSQMPAIFGKCKALVYASIEEDFGLAPVEAMSHGLPIIAFKDGGVRETVIKDKTGVFFYKYNQKSLDKAIQRFENKIFNRQEIIEHASQFSHETFKEKILKLAF